MTGYRTVQAGSTMPALAGLTMQKARSWLYVLAIVIGAFVVAENLPVSWHDRRIGVFVQVLIFGSMWLNKMPSARMVSMLPQTRRQSETTLWLLSFAVPFLYYAVIFGSKVLIAGTHGRTILPPLLMLVGCTTMQGIMVLAWSFRADSAGRIGWAGWTSRSAARLSTALVVTGFAMFLSPGLVPSQEAPGAAMFAFAAGGGATVLVWLRRDTLLKRHTVAAGGSGAASVSMRGWSALAAMLLPLAGLTLIGSAGIPLLMLVARHNLPLVTPILLAAPVIFACLMPMALLRDLRVIRMLPVSASVVAILLIVALAAGPTATCLILGGALAIMPEMRVTVLTIAGWAAPTMALYLLFIPLALRFERLWLAGAFGIVFIGIVSLCPLLFAHGMLPILPLGGNTAFCLILLAGGFLWLRTEIGSARGIALRTAATS